VLCRGSAAAATASGADSRRAPRASAPLIRSGSADHAPGPGARDAPGARRAGRCFPCGRRMSSSTMRCITCCSHCPANRPLAGQQLVEDQTAEKMSDRALLVALRDVLRRHVRRRARQLPAVARQRLGARGDAEIHHPRRAIVVDQDVARLEVTMDDSRRMGVGNRIEDRLHDRDRLAPAAAHRFAAGTRQGSCPARTGRPDTDLPAPRPPRRSARCSDAATG
jgi:hypothetical protein